MAGNIKGITIAFNGDTTKLDKALRDVDKSTKDIDKELKQVNKDLKFNPNSVELWRQKQTLLNDKIHQTKDRLDVLKQAQKSMDAEGVEKNSAEYRKLQREIIETESKLKTFESQLRKVGNAKLSALSAQFSKIGSSLTSAGRTMAPFSAAAGAGLTYAAKSASDFEENINKVEVAFGDASDEVKAWANSATASFGLSTSQALEATSLFGDMATSMGLSQSEAAAMSTSLAGLAGDLSSFKNIDIESAMNALNGVFTGETESLKKLGIVMTQTNLEEFAAKTGKVYSEMSQAEKVQLRYNYVLSQTQNAQGDYARTSDGTANSIRTFQATIQNLAATLGQQLLPIITPIITRITEFIQRLSEANPLVMKIIVIAGMVVTAIAPVLLILGSLFTGISSVITILNMLPPAFTAALGPIGLIVAAVGAFISALVYAYNHSEKFRNIVNAVFTKVKEVVGTVIEFIKERMAIMLSSFTNAIEFIKSIPDRVRAIVQKIKDFIKLPHFSLTGELSLIPPSVPKVSVDWYANGGIFTKPTVFGGVGVGEAGAEAVLPLKKLWEEMDKRFAQPGLVVNVYGSDNMSVDELAMKVQEKIITLSNRRRQAWA